MFYTARWLGCTYSEQNAVLWNEFLSIFHLATEIPQFLLISQIYNREFSIFIYVLIFTAWFEQRLMGYIDPLYF